MANKKISQLTAAATLTGTELLPIVQDGVTVQTTAQDIADLGGVNPIYNVQLLFESGVRFEFNSLYGPNVIDKLDVVINILGFGSPERYRLVTLLNQSIIQVKNANLLTNLEDVGTGTAFNLSLNQLTASEINSIFTQLPLTTNVATINVSGNPGAATCDPTIATAKGYTVVV
jgi:hypothetical protein